MSNHEPTAETTLVIIIGASEWPRYPEFEALPGAQKSAEAVLGYFLDDKSFGLPPENLQYLFNAHEASPRILAEISRFLRSRIEELRDEGQPARDIIIYYVGHGGFANPTNDYFLAVRSTQLPDPYLSSIPVLSLAKALKQETRHLRRHLILDSCFSGAASKSFEASSPVEIAAQKTGDAFPPSGTALLCSSGARDPSKAPPDLTYTMFSGALLGVLRNGDVTVPQNLSLQDLAHATRLRLRQEFDDEGVRPEVHAPEQRFGSLDEIPLFPNPQVKQVKAEPRRNTAEEAKRRAMEEQHKIKEADQKVDDEAKREAEEATRRKAEEAAERKSARETKRKAEEAAKRKATRETKRKALKANQRGDEYYHAENYSDSMNWYRKAAAQGNVGAQSNIRAIKERSRRAKLIKKVPIMIIFLALIIWVLVGLNII